MPPKRSSKVTFRDPNFDDDGAALIVSSTNPVRQSKNIKLLENEAELEAATFGDFSGGISNNNRKRNVYSL